MHLDGYTRTKKLQPRQANVGNTQQQTHSSPARSALLTIDRHENVNHSFVGDTFFEQMQLPPEHILGRPLATIVDARDTHDLRSALFQVLGQKHTDGGRGVSSSGTLVHIRVISGGRSCQASMSIRIGSQGLVVVTRLY